MKRPKQPNPRRVYRGVDGMDRNQLRKAQDSREKAQHDRIERLLAEIVKRPREAEFEVVDALMEFEESRMIALSSSPPQASAAVAATMAKCKLMGLIIERSASVIAKGQIASMQGHPEEQEAAIFERLSERVGAERAQVFMKFVENMRAAYRGDIIEGEVNDDPG